MLPTSASSPPAMACPTYAKLPSQENNRLMALKRKFRADKAGDCGEMGMGVTSHLTLHARQMRRDDDVCHHLHHAHHSDCQCHCATTMLVSSSLQSSTSQVAISATYNAETRKVLGDKKSLLEWTAKVTGLMTQSC